MPYKYTCTTRLVYSLKDAATGNYINGCNEKVAEARAGADYTKETIAGVIALGALFAKGNVALKYLAGLLGIAGVSELNHSVQRAVNRCPAIAAETVFDQMFQDISHAADYSARVTAIDYSRGTIRLNIGTADGINVSTRDNPSEFDIDIDGHPLPESESGNAADYYSAVVVGADEHSCLCELHHVTRKVHNASESSSDTIATQMLRSIPQPSTGEVSAVANVRFPSSAVITDAEVKAADEGVNNTPAAPPPANNAAPADPLDALKKGIGNILKGFPH